ncbi:MAG TPA: primosomal protein N' [Verrucomicrobiae bacterium]|nr:primosomal protein N' [Verrucomicrobiae bacterium]
MTRLFAEVIVDVHNRKVDRSFHYSLPEHLHPEIGSRVIVPFNKRNVEGVVVGFTENPPVSALKPIISCLDTCISPELIELARWMADYYICPFIQAIQCVLPASAQVKQEIVVEALVPVDDPDVVALSLLDPDSARIFNAVAQGKKPVKLNNLTKRLGKEISPLLDDLVARGILGLTSQYRMRSHREASYVSGEDILHERKTVMLTQTQREAVEGIAAALATKEKTVLLHGVTGSGKTEVYLKTVAQVLHKGQTALVLVPEISLTPQIYNVFAQAFPGQVAILHSSLSAGQRAGEYKKITAGEARVVVGARSAVFAPLPNLGLIIIDEEHEQSYKQDESPKYHVREVAQKRAEMVGAMVLLGSATPALESYALALTGKYKLVNMLERVENRPLPRVEIIDMREELLAGNKLFFSRNLSAKMEDRFAKGEQVILFLNRRGHSTFIVCRECGYVAKCPHCDITLTYHFGSGKLVCHYCDYHEPAPADCPGCNSKQIRYFGLGTQRVEQEIGSLFPGVKVLRMDADSTGRAGAHDSILSAFRKGEAQVLVGTQMIAKGLDFPKVTLVGVVSADITLNMPDFRSKERTFQLLTQVAGRAGRGELPGEVIIQTFSPEDPSIIQAHQHNYGEFFQHEIKFRQALGYPPFNHILRAVLSAEDENNLIKCAQDLGGALRQEVARINQTAKSPLGILGPAPSPLSKLKGRYRWQVMVKGKQVTELKVAMGQAIKELYRFGSTAGISLSLDLDPMGMN